MLYPPSVPEEKRFAIGHEFYGLLPGLFVYSTVWLREHNRICDVLRGEHPEWDDERIFQTAKLITVGKCCIKKHSMFLCRRILGYSSYILGCQIIQESHMHYMEIAWLYMAMVVMILP